MVKDNNNFINFVNDMEIEINKLDNAGLPAAGHAEGLNAPGLLPPGDNVQVVHTMNQATPAVIPPVANPTINASIPPAIIPPTAGAHTNPFIPAVTHPGNSDQGREATNMSRKNPADHQNRFRRGRGRGRSRANYYQRNNPYKQVFQGFAAFMTEKMDSKRGKKGPKPKRHQKFRDQGNHA